MALFKRVPPEGQKGKISYNSGIVSGIVALAIKEVEGVELLAGKKKGLKLYFEKDGIYAEISVNADYGYSVPDVAFKIQQAVKHNVEAIFHRNALRNNNNKRHFCFPLGFSGGKQTVRNKLLRKKGL